MMHHSQKKGEWGLFLIKGGKNSLQIFLKICSIIQSLHLCQTLYIHVEVELLIWWVEPCAAEMTLTFAIYNNSHYEFVVATQSY